MISSGASRARRAADYGLTIPAVAAGVAAGVLAMRAGAAPFAATPLALVVALSAWHGGLGPGLFALLQSAVAIDVFLVQSGAFGVGSPAQAAVFAGFVVGWLIFCVLAEKVYQQVRLDRQRRASAESASSHASRLAQLTAALAQARTPRAAIEASLQEPLHALKADAGMLLLTSRDGQTAEIARAAGYPEGQQPETISLAERGPISDAVGRGAPVILESRQVREMQYPVGGPLDFSAQFESVVVMPLLIGSRVVAVVQIEFHARRILSADDHDYVRAFATHAARALDRTWQLEFAERARSDAEHLRAQAHQELAERKTMEHALRASETRYRALAARTSRLHTLSSALSEAVTTDAVARAVVTHGRIVAGATTGEVMMLVEDGTQFDTLYDESAGPGSADRRTPVEDGLCATDAVRTRRPVFVTSLADWQARYWRSASVAADGGFESSATMPILVEGAPIGVLAFHFTVPVNFDSDYQALLTSVAQHCAQALDRARLYESTQRARADAERANRIKDEFVSVVSHELRTPLSAILGWANMLQRGTLSGEKATRALQSIADNARRQARLIEELLDFSRVAAGRTPLQMERVDIRELIRSVVESMVPTAAVRGLELRLSPAPAVDVEGDVRRLEQVFFNLIDNALKFTPKGGWVALDVRVDDGQVEVQVSDNGAGIEAEFLPRVFDRFRQADSTTSRAHGGLGLGLSIAQQLVELHKGTIAAESPGKGRGATFTVRLPAAACRADDFPDRPRAVDRVEASIAETRLDGLRVLVVDDEADAREVMAQTLELYGASVEVAENVREALEILAHSPVDVMLADIAMPDEDGYALIRQVRASNLPAISSIPAAAVTAFTRDEHRQHALSAGFQVHLGKPFQPAELVRAVDLLAHRAIH